ncbi:MAG: CHAT domain-containing protein, partial [Cyanobacteriota bacterium]
GLSTAEPIDQMTGTFKELGTREADGRNLRPVSMEIVQKVSTSIGSALRAAIFDPLLNAIGSRKRLFLAPDGNLTKLPFEVLPIDSDRRLIDEYHISYLSTGRDVLRFGAVSTGKYTEPLVVADPDFDLSCESAAESVNPPSLSDQQSKDLDRRTLTFKRLPGTKVEGEQIAGILNVKPWLAERVLETHLKACHSPRLLHLATHGFFLRDQQRDLYQSVHQGQLGFGTVGGINQSWMGRLSGQGLENPLLRSGLALAGANTWLKNGSLPKEAEDGILTAEDVSGLDLLDTDLVVLSACETGLGEVQTGEGVFGLRRAFVLAGAKTLVISLWKVPDKQTQELMADFYRRLLDGQSRSEALREAQLVMKVKYPNPYYWGAFICQGVPNPLQLPR